MQMVNTTHLLGLALFLMQVTISFPNTTNVATEQLALLALKSHLNLDNSHILLNNWSTSTSVCSWIGVTCSPRHHKVTALDISSMELTGDLPPEVGNLSFLESFNLSMNYFSGNLPQEMSRLGRLQIIDFSVNNFTGELPSWFQFLAQLKVLNLRNNNFSGTLPNSITNISKLEVLDVSINSLHGEIPKDMKNVRSLRELVLEYNELSGTITHVFNISKLERLNLRGNMFSGDLPSDMCRGIPWIQELRLSLNYLNSIIPSTISQCIGLRSLYLTSNIFISGTIPREIGNLSALEILAIGANKITGEIPRSIGNLTMLTAFDVGTNNLTGIIPEEIDRLYKLKLLNIGYNNISGYLSEKIFNITTLEAVDMSENQLSGKLPQFLGNGLPNLQRLYLGFNSFIGRMPESISNASRLAILYLGENQLSGPIPSSLQNLKFLERLGLFYNNFISESSELSIITSLTNCTNLMLLDMGYNLALNGTLPVTIGNFSNSTLYITINHCGIYGRIPHEISNLKSLLSLDLGWNQLTGSIPRNVGDMKNLQQLDISHNKLGGTLPNGLCELQNLQQLRLYQNRLTTLPDCLGELTALRYLDVGNNMLSPSIPMNLWQLNDLLYLNLSSNFLTGSLPTNIGNMIALVSLDLSTNQFSSHIPSTVGNLQNLYNLSLADNRFTGSIPDSMENMFSLVYLNLSHNNLSGSIPNSLQSLRDLTYFDVSFNDLRGQIPSNGSFKNFTSQWFASNVKLCGDPRYSVPPCQSTNTGGSMKRKRFIIIVCALLGVTLLVSAMALAFVVARYRMKTKMATQTSVRIETAPIRVSYYDIENTTEGFNESHLIGMGGFSSVYKGTLRDERPVAIKVINLQLEGACTNFDTECEMLSRLRHRNLCKIIGVCSNESFKALVLEYMPNSSLEKWLYSEECFLDVMQRVNMIVDVACALEYLHHGYSVPVLHCDLKPSNVLLDENMVARLSDFGISKLLSEGDNFAQSRTLATFGYMAPEYGSGGLVSVRSDVYSYGIMLMEVFTRLRPSSEAFAEYLSLKGLVHDSWPNEIMRIIDSRLFSRDDELFAEKLECISSILELALKCSMESPNERISMKDVVVQLGKIKMKLFTCLEENRRGHATN